jgi:hypothetical protein
MLQLANAWDGRLRRIKRIAESIHRETPEKNLNQRKAVE